MFFGIVLFIIGESMMAIKTFKMELPFQDISIMFFYGASVYLIIIGIVNEQYKVINPSEPILSPID